MTSEALAALVALSPQEIQRASRLLCLPHDLDRSSCALVFLYSVLRGTGLDDVVVLDALRRYSTNIREQVAAGEPGALSIIDGRYAQYGDCVVYDTETGEDVGLPTVTYCFTVFLLPLLVLLLPPWRFLLSHRMPTK